MSDQVPDMTVTTAYGHKVTMAQNDDGQIELAAERADGGPVIILDIDDGIGVIIRDWLAQALREPT